VPGHEGVGIIEQLGEGVTSRRVGERASPSWAAPSWPLTDISDAKLDLARELGAEHTVNAGRTEPVAALEALGGLDVAVVLAVSPHVFEEAFASLRRGGRLICVALPGDAAKMDIPVFETVLKGISIIGSIVGTRQDLAPSALPLLGRSRLSATRSTAGVWA